MGKIGQPSTKAKVDSGEDGEDGDNQLRCQHALPGAHALLAEGCVGRAVLGSIRVRTAIVAAILAGTTTTAGRHGDR